MILHDISLYASPGRYHLHVKKGLILSLCESRAELDHIKNAERIELDGALVLPGLINSHDHLDFNLFPAAGNRIYEGYREWADDISSSHKKEFARVLKIPVGLRTAWGVYKNLLNGFTTVINHGDKLRLRKTATGVFQKCLSLHSPAFEKNWEKKIQQHAGKNKPVVMHLGEGSTVIYHQEISEVLFKKPRSVDVIAVHGVAMDTEQAGNCRGLVWCPASNFFLLGKTAAIDILKKETRVVFGTDSTLTASWNAWEHFRKGLHTGMVTENELIDMLTTRAAQLWNFKDKGMITENRQADLLVIPRAAVNESIFQANPEKIKMVVQEGKIRLISSDLAKQLNKKPGSSYSQAAIAGHEKWVAGDLPGLWRKIKKYFPGGIVPFE